MRRRMDGWIDRPGTPRVVVGGAHRLGWAVAEVLDGRHDAKAPTVDGTDDLLPSAVVAHGFAGGLDTAGQCRLAHEPIAPDVAEVGQHVEDLGLDGQGTPVRRSSKDT